MQVFTRFDLTEGKFARECRDTAGNKRGDSCCDDGRSASLLPVNVIPARQARCSPRPGEAVATADAIPWEESPPRPDSTGNICCTIACGARIV
ncbi:MAG: hypothetical protein FWD12_05060 [Alphaproteobacteria bacterium]|nr:hypothetical protein [Alphaproteobacteria bacterium]